MALIVAGERSGVGKTTITLALLSYLVQKQKRVQSFKVGPDYIDPMFHSKLTKIPCRNLDPLLTSPDYLRSCFYRHSQNVDCVLIEGVMGLFDGVGQRDYASTAHIARLLKIPVLLILDCSGLSHSIAAIANGYRNLDPKVKIIGVVLNRVASDRHLELLENALKTISCPILGVLYRHKQITIPDRHLGLIPTEEIPEIKNIFNSLAHIGKTCFNWSQLLPLLENTPTLNLPSPPKTPKKIRIAIARDRAFNFYYQDNFDILETLGAELIFWSPLEDSHLPKNIAGLYFGGGFPEMFGSQLTNNRSIRQQIYRSINSGIPVYAECGGLMYLCDRLIDFHDRSWEMVGAIPTTVTMGKKLTLGYRQATPLQNTSAISIDPPKAIWGHEFHRSFLNSPPSPAIWQLKGFSSHSKIKSEGYQIHNVHASYLHLHFGELQFIPQRWVQSCQNYFQKLP